MQHFGDSLYSTGFFTNLCGHNHDYVAHWDGNEWSSSSISLGAPGHSITSIGDTLYFGSYVETTDSNWVFFWDGSQIDTLGNGVYLTTASGFSELANIYDIIEFHGEIIACGEFDRVGANSISGIMRWNGQNWEGLSSGLSGSIPGGAQVMYPHQMHVFNNELYVVGNFQYAGGVEVNGIAKWDGSSWSGLGDGFNGTVYAIGEYNGELYVGGDFTANGTNPLNRIARWNGSNWESIGFGFTNPSPSDYSFVHTLFPESGGLYIAGGLKQIEYDSGGTQACGGIIHLSSAGINDFNGGVANNDIEGIAVTESNQVLVGGGVFGSSYVGIIDNTSSIGQLNSTSVEVWPNPAKDVINFESKKEIDLIRVFDNRGNLLDKFFSTEQISTKTYPSGIIILEIESEGMSIIKRITKL